MSLWPNLALKWNSSYYEGNIIYLSGQMDRFFFFFFFHEDEKMKCSSITFTIEKKSLLQRWRKWIRLISHALASVHMLTLMALICVILHQLRFDHEFGFISNANSPDWLPSFIPKHHFTWRWLSSFQVKLDLVPTLQSFFESPRAGLLGRFLGSGSDLKPYLLFNLYRNLWTDDELCR